MRQAKQLSVVRPHVAAECAAAETGGNAKPFTWQRTALRLMQAPWVQDSEQQQRFVTTSVSVTEESSPQYALTFTVTIVQLLPKGTRQQHVAMRVVRKVTKQHMASAFERAVSSDGVDAHTNGFAQLRTRSIESSNSNKKLEPQRRDIDDAVRQWLLQSKAAPSREEIVLWLLSRMILVQDREAEAWNLLICGEQGAEHPVAVVGPRPAKVKLSVKPSAAQPKQGEREVQESDGDEDDEEELPDYEERSVRANEIAGHEDEDDGETSDTPPREFGDADGRGGDERVAPEDQDQDPSLAVPHNAVRHWAWLEAANNLKSALESAKNNSSKLSAFTATASSTGSTLGLESMDRATSVQPELPVSHPRGPTASETRRATKSQYTFEPASMRILRRSATCSNSSFDADLNNEWTQDRKSFQLELAKSRKDIQVAKDFQRKTETIAHLRRQQLLTQSQRRLRAHDQKRDDSRQVSQLIADTLEYHELLYSLETQVKRTRIATKREQERLSQTMRVAIGRGDRHVKGPILGTGPLSQREMDAQLSIVTTRSNRDGHYELVDTPFVYDLHGRRHAAEDAGDIVALGVFESAMLKIKRVLDSSSTKAGSSHSKNHHLLETFHQFDTNRSGTLNRDEFANALLAHGVKLTREQSRVFFDHFDVNHSGEIDYGELLWGFFNRRAFLKKWQQKKTRLSARETKLLFYQYDRMGRGALSVVDFQLAMENLGFQLTESELTLLVLKFDANQDGFIDYHEFHAFVSNGEEDDENIEMTAAGGNRDAESQSHRDGKERRGSKSRSAAALGGQYQQPNAKGNSGDNDGSVEQILRELRALSETQMKIRQSIRK